MKTCLALLTGTLLLMASGLLAQSPYAPAPGVLVMRTGQTLRGHIVRQGDQFHVEIAEGNEIRVPAEHVRLHAPTLEEAYLAQRDSLTPSDTAGRLRLAHWCLSAELPHRAADQLLAVRLLDPTHEGLPAVQGRLAAWEMTRRAARATSLATQQENQQASADSASSFDTSALEAVVAQLSPDQVETFAKRVQPLLVNRCGASGCHGFNSQNNFKLLRPSFHNTFTQRYTQRNLASSMNQIEQVAPEKSPLLEQALIRHGGEPEPVLLDKRTQQNELLAGWIRSVTGVQKVPTQEAPPQKPTPQEDKPARVKPTTKQLLQNRQPTNAVAGGANAVESTQSPNGSAEKKAAEESMVQQATHEGKSPAGNNDPVDASVFNRRYHGRP